jgi:hypothetical protein
MTNECKTAEELLKIIFNSGLWASAQVEKMAKFCAGKDLEYHKVILYLLPSKTNNY